MKTKGLTLIELLGAISIAGILCFAGIPGLANLVEKESAKRAGKTLLHAVAQAREHAVYSEGPVSICPSIDGVNCRASWSPRIIVYRDKKGDGTLGGQEDILYTAQLHKDWRVKWSAFGRKPQLTITAQGYTKHQNGSFYLCPADDTELGKRVSVNKAGRARIAPDKDNDGYAEKTDGENMSCQKASA